MKVYFRTEIDRVLVFKIHEFYSTNKHLKRKSIFLFFFEKKTKIL